MTAPFHSPREAARAEQAPANPQGAGANPSRAASAPARVRPAASSLAAGGTPPAALLVAAGGFSVHRRLGPEVRPMPPHQREAVRAAQPARLLSRRLLAAMTSEEAATYRIARQARLSIRDALRVAGRADLMEPAE